jgi:hypothetical protein
VFYGYSSSLLFFGISQPEKHQQKQQLIGQKNIRHLVGGYFF